MRFFHNLKLNQKIILSFLAVLFLTYSLLAVSADVFFTRSTTGLADKYTLQGIQQVNASIESHFENIESIIDMVAKDSNIIDFLSWSNSRPNALVTRSNVRSTLTNAVDTVHDIVGIMVVNSNNFYISNEMYHNSPTPIVEDSWYQTCTRRGSLTLLHPVAGRRQKYFHAPEAYDIVTLAKPVYLPNSSVPAGALLVDVDVGFIQKIVEDVSWDKTGFVYILNGSDVLYSPVNDITPRVKTSWFEENDGVFEKQINRRRYEFVFTRSQFTGWLAIGVFSLEKTLEPIANFRYFIVASLAITCLCAIVTVSLLSRTIVNPILSLNRLMRKAASQDLDVHFDVEYTDEIGELGNSFNSMVSETKELIEMVKAEQHSKRRAELQMLQEQIKPHFLYNTFDTIHWIAKSYGATEVMDIIRALTTVLRVGLSRGRETIPLKQELDHAVSYLTIQQIRYGDKLTYNIMADPECEDFLVQKLILQPLIENAIYHGIKNRRGRGNILVEVFRKDGNLVLAVSDNGPGIEPERLAEVYAALENRGVQDTVYGLFNVNERIRISYGAWYGVRIRTKPGRYTRMEIYHPIIEESVESTE